MVVVPLNDAARKVQLMGVGTTLSDDTGGMYLLKGGATRYDEENPRGHVREQFIFSGIIPDSTKALTLTTRGGDEIVGPFVFEDVHVSYDTIKPTATPTPIPIPYRKANARPDRDCSPYIRSFHYSNTYTRAVGCSLKSPSGGGKAHGHAHLGCV